MDGDIVIIVKFIIGLLVTLKSLFTLFQAWRGAQENMNKIDFLTMIVYVLLTVVPVFRLVGLMIQASKRGSMIRAGCLEYQISFADNPNIREIDQYELDYHHNYQWDTFYLMGRDEQKFYNENNATYKRLYVTPFNKQCLTDIDYCYLTGKAVFRLGKKIMFKVLGCVCFSAVYFCLLLLLRCVDEKKYLVFSKAMRKPSKVIKF